MSLYFALLLKRKLSNCDILCSTSLKLRQRTIATEFTLILQLQALFSVQTPSFANTELCRFSETLASRQLASKSLTRREKHAETARLLKLVQRIRNFHGVRAVSLSIEQSQTTESFQMTTPYALAGVTSLIMSAAAFAAPGTAQEAVAEQIAFASTTVMPNTIDTPTPQVEKVEEPSAIYYRSYEYPDYTVIEDYTSFGLTPPPSGHYYAEMSLGIVEVSEKTNMIMKFAR
tara:strand:- start:31875 stop:32567 length:693 start_codon:yes stop_codon:yes gene_type:complete